MFLDDCFASDSAVATLAPYFELRDFRVIFPDEKKGKQNGVLDTPVIRKCHEEKWLLLTTDHEMKKTHLEEIKKNPDVTILATAHNSSSPEEYRAWLAAVIKLKPQILRMYKKQQRAWFATFSREGNITSLHDDHGRAHDAPDKKKIALFNRQDSVAVSKEPIRSQSTTLRWLSFHTCS